MENDPFVLFLYPRHRRHVLPCATDRETRSKPPPRPTANIKALPRRCRRHLPRLLACRQRLPWYLSAAYCHTGKPGGSLLPQHGPVPPRSHSPRSDRRSPGSDRLPSSRQALLEPARPVRQASILPRQARKGRDSESSGVQSDRVKSTTEFGRSCHGRCAEAKLIIISSLWQFAQ